MEPLKFHASFEGIGGFRLGFERAGMACTGANEIVPHRQTILDRHWPGSHLEGDIKDVRGSSIGDPDVMVGGFPCEDTSIAAPHRLGLDGARSGLFYEFVRLVDEYLRLVEYARPRWVVLENTPGLLKSRGGRDMAAVAVGLEELGYGWAYRLVDGSALGTPQRRRRLVLVGHRGGDPRPAWQVLGDTGAGGETAASGDDGRAGPGPRTGPIAQRNGGLIRVWRKGANPRMSIEKGYAGGYRETWVDDGYGRVLTGFDWGGPTRQTHLIAQNGRLRTCTLTEWERLAGFPDDWTAGIPDSERGHALGDSFHPGTAYWLGRRLVQEHHALPQLNNTDIRTVGYLEPSLGGTA